MSSKPRTSVLPAPETQGRIRLSRAGATHEISPPEETAHIHHSRRLACDCEPIVEDLLDEVRASGVIHADEWWQGLLGRWLWVVLSATTAVFQGPSENGRFWTVADGIAPR
jgi:hypothetical protein